MNKKPNFTNNSWNGFNWLLAALALCLTVPARAGTQPAAIPFPDIGARATVGYQGDALGVTATSDGARLRCGFQKLAGHATPEGLWLESTKPGGAGRLRLTATALGRAGLSTLNPRPSTTLATTGTVSVGDKLVRFTRPGLTEEYSVSVDGVRQDFIIESPPLNPPPSAVLLRRTGQLLASPKPGDGGSTLNQSAGDLRVELALSGARAEASACGARLRLDGSGRALAYSRLRVEDATGRELTAHLEVLSADRVAVSVTDANATYPVRIDPTFSDADWVSLNPGLPGANDEVDAIAVDGSGIVYVGGDFTVIGTVVANHIAKWDGSGWSALGSGMDGSVWALVVSGTDLYAGGSFTTAGGVAATNIAKWNGSVWSALSSGMNRIVEALAVIGTNLYAGGFFTTAGGVAATNIAKWDGSAWSVVGSGMGGSDPEVDALAVSGTSLYAGGSFATAGGVTANNIAKWDGSAWSALGSGMNADGYVDALAVSGTDLYAGGSFTTAGGVTANNIAKWDGGAWSALGSGMNADGDVLALTVSGTNLYAGGDFTAAGGVPANNIAKWDGTAWSALGAGLAGNGVFALTVSGTDLYAGGVFTIAGGVTANRIAKWDGGAWSALALGIDNGVLGLAVSGTDLYIGGAFTTAGGVTANNIAKWDGSAWSALGAGLAGNGVYALAVSGTNLYAGGDFTAAGGVPANYIAKWDGSAWSALGPGMDSYVSALAVSATDLYAGGGFTTAAGVAANRIARWNGSAWSALGSGLNGGVAALAVGGTNLYAGGNFTMAGGVPANYIAKWDGRAWSALGLGLNNQVFALAVSGTNLYVGGYFTTAGGVTVNCIAKWDGSAWSALGSGMNYYVRALAVSGTDLYAGGVFTTAGGIPASYIAKWDGSAWSALGSGMSGGSYPDVWALAADGADHLLVGGHFYLAGTNVSPFIAQANLCSAPTIITSPQSQTAEIGATVDLSVDVAGGELTYLWSFNGTNLLGCSTNCDVELTNVQFSGSGAYTVIVTNRFGAVTSAPVMLNVIPAVERRPVPGVKVAGEPGRLLNVDYAGFLSHAPEWTPLGAVSLTSTSQYYFDLTLPLPPQRYYQAWQTGIPSAMPPLDLHIVPAITLTGNVGGSVRVDAINQFGPIDAWFTLDTVTLTNTSQLYFDVSAWRQPQRLYRLVPLP